MIPISFAARCLLVVLAAVLVSAVQPGLARSDIENISNAMGLKGLSATCFEKFGDSSLMTGKLKFKWTDFHVDGFINHVEISHNFGEAEWEKDLIKDDENLEAFVYTNSARKKLHVLTLPGTFNKYAMAFDVGDVNDVQFYGCGKLQANWEGVVSHADIAKEFGVKPPNEFDVKRQADEKLGAFKNILIELQKSKGTIRPKRTNGMNTGAYSDLDILRCPWDSNDAINIAFCPLHNLAGRVIAVSFGVDFIKLLVGTKNIVIDFGAFSRDVIYHYSACWSLEGFSAHHAAIMALEANNATVPLLMISFGNAAFNSSRSTNQELFFGYVGGELSVKLKDGSSQEHVIPFKIDVKQWYICDVYIYLAADDDTKTRALISLSCSPSDCKHFELVRFDLINPQYRLASLLTAGLDDGWKSAVYKQLFQGFKAKSGAMFNFIIETDNDDITLVHRTHEGKCCKMAKLHVQHSKLDTSTKVWELSLGNERQSLVTAKFNYTNYAIECIEITFDEELAMSCDGDYVIGLDRMHYL
eukprot:GHVS01062447.1.p1 GENE.GHVS01062447.1~~GHVS01062447.1.p1  ORF type:complete len:528 (+),score=31.41 GHVS01062447.1:172-1755(+)